MWPLYRRREKLTHSSYTGNCRMWVEVAGCGGRGRRNFPFVKVKGFGRQQGAASNWELLVEAAPFF